MSLWNMGFVLGVLAGGLLIFVLSTSGIRFVLGLFVVTQAMRYWLLAVAGVTGSVALLGIDAGLIWWTALVGIIGLAGILVYRFPATLARQCSWNEQHYYTTDDVRTGIRQKHYFAGGPQYKQLAILSKEIPHRKR